MASPSVSDHHNGDKNQRITVDLVIQALEALKENNGTTLTSLKKYFSSNLPAHIPSRDISFQLKKAIDKGLRDGKISKQGRNKFFLGLDDDDAGSRKGRRRKVDEDDPRSHRRRRSRKRRCRRRRRSRCRRRKRRSCRRRRRSRRRRCRRRRRRSRRRRC